MAKDGHLFNPKNKDNEMNNKKHYRILQWDVRMERLDTLNISGTQADVDVVYDRVCNDLNIGMAELVQVLHQHRPDNVA